VSLNADLLRASFALAITRRADLAERFYATLFERHPTLRALFRRTPATVQARMLGQALAAVLDHLEDAAWIASTLRELGQRHAHYGVTDEMYDQVGAVLVATLAEAVGEAWTPEHEQQWTLAFGAIAGMMREGVARAAA
jgi:hemoglobin-like flavoprotein